MSVRVCGKVVPEPQSVADLRRDFAEILAPYEKELRATERARLRTEQDAEDARLRQWYIDAGRRS